MERMTWSKGVWNGMPRCVIWYECVSWYERMTPVKRCDMPSGWCWWLWKPAGKQQGTPLPLLATLSIIISIVTHCNATVSIVVQSTTVSKDHGTTVVLPPQYALLYPGYHQIVLFQSQQYPLIVHSIVAVSSQFFNSLNHRVSWTIGLLYRRSRYSCVLEWAILVSIEYSFQTPSLA